MYEKEREVANSKWLRLRYSGVCYDCGGRVATGENALYEQGSKRVQCLECAQALPTETPSSHQTSEDPKVFAENAGVAGASARHEYERRRANDEAHLRQKWGKLGGIAVTLSDEKQSTKAWEIGAAGEERLGARLDSLASESIAVLHDRRIPGTRANIDHIAITRAGVWVIDAKRYAGQPELRVDGGILRPRVERLFVGRRDCTGLVDGVLKQVDLVQYVVGATPVFRVLCFVEADWPLIGGEFATRGVQVLWLKRLAKLLSDASGDVEVNAARAVIISHFKSAS